jgi:hypothetical protein
MAQRARGREDGADGAQGGAGYPQLLVSSLGMVQIPGEALNEVVHADSVNQLGIGQAPPADRALGHVAGGRARGRAPAVSLARKFFCFSTAPTLSSKQKCEQSNSRPKSPRRTKVPRLEFSGLMG